MIVCDDIVYVQQPAVSVIILCYNQEATIAQTIESIINQNFPLPYEVIIGDDASSDNTQSICKAYQQQYPSQIKLLLHEKNKGVVENYKAAVLACSGKYVSSCAGDDYWTHRQKLLLQYNYLECHPEAALVHTAYCTLSTKNNAIEELPIGEMYAAEDRDALLNINCIGALTVLSRMDLVRSAIADGVLNSGFGMEDYPLWLYLAEQGTIGYINEYTAVWRRQAESLSQSGSVTRALLFDMSLANIRYHFAKRRAWPKNTKQAVADTYRYLLRRAYLLKSRETVQKCIMRLKELDDLVFTDRILAYPVFLPVYKALRRLLRKDNNSAQVSP